MTRAIENSCAEFNLKPEALLPEVEFSEAERLAIDHAVNAAKKSGSWDLQREELAHRFEMNYGSR